MMRGRGSCAGFVRGAALPCAIFLWQGCGCDLLAAPAIYVPGTAGSGAAHTQKNRPETIMISADFLLYVPCALARGPVARAEPDAYARALFLVGDAQLQGFQIGPDGLGV